MLISIKEVAVLIKRHVSAVEKYMNFDKPILPRSCHRDKPTNTNYWCSEDVKRHLPKVRAYQISVSSNLRTSPRRKKTSITGRTRPPETPGQEAARLSFDLCVNIAC